ncbi:NADH:flavin oxidoreductase/NADH oxidase [Earliella scabrosa]|nr:NADH:flavin oxidoreductase/NADH oxidase [Earliella scabrosa]
MSETPETETVPMLFQPVKVGDLTLAHRVVLAPLTRCRANVRSAHTDIAVTYYSQRGSVPGTLLITEATVIAPFAGTMTPHMPGIWSEEQIAAWKRVADGVHEKGSYLFLQLWAQGRAAFPAALKAVNPDYPYVSASDIPMSDRPDDIPRPLTIPEIKEYAEAHAQAARNAVFGAGCDGVELHCANGYLPDQFLQDVSNRRTDEYGGSIENRCRFTLEMIDAVVAVVGAKKVGLRISPWATYQDMGMKDPIPTFTYLVSQVVQRHPDLAYLHVIEPGVAASEDCTHNGEESNDFLRQLWHPRPFISAGRYTRESAIKRAEKTSDLIAFGRRFISNADLPLRLRKNLPLAPWTRDSYYSFEDPHGYIDFPFAKDVDTMMQ